jgi:exopolyphosphatase/guanosine-5'-triphosphate,3'-diphosphate pyrophosphatase
LGSLRIERDLQGYQLSTHTEDVLREYLFQQIEQIVGAVEPATRLSMVALGSELRFACHHQNPAWDTKQLGRLALPDLETFTRRVLATTPEETARTYSLSVQQAENMAPALYVLLAVGKALRQKSVLVAEGSLRHGVLVDLLGDPGWNEEFRRQVISSTIVVARRYRVDIKHARHVAGYANTLLAALHDQFTFNEHDDVILTVAALLHEIGMFVNDRSYHKHTLYLVEHSEIFGLGTDDLRLAARVARYHRRAAPKMTHDEYTDMTVEERVCVSKLAAILRVANALDHLRPSRAFELDTCIAEEAFIITIRSALDLTLTRHHLAERAEMFRAVFGMRVVLRAGPDVEARFEDDGDGDR